MRKAIKETNFDFKGLVGKYKGKVRDVYFLEDDKMAMVVTDRISAFDHVLPKAIPYKGMILNNIAIHHLNKTSDIIPNWMESSPDPNVIIGKKCEPFKVEMVIRAYLTGHAWRVYKSGERMICGVSMPEGMKENDRFEEPILTPTTKADVGHDEDISREEILKQGIVSEEDYTKLEEYTRALFARGTEISAERGLILVDTKYEFGKIGDTIYLIDEIHTPDSSRFFYKEGYEERQANGESQVQLSKEFVREWLIENGFQGKEGQVMPYMTEDLVKAITDRYAELYELLIGEKLNLDFGDEDPNERIFRNVNEALMTAE